MATKKTSGKAKAAPKASDAESKKTRGRAAGARAGGASAAKPGKVAAAPEKALPADEHPALTELKQAPLPAVEGETALVPEAEAPKAPKAGARAPEPTAASKAAKAEAVKAAPAAGPRMPAGISPRPLMAGNAYLPKVATVAEIIQETRNIRTLRVVLDDADAM